MALPSGRFVLRLPPRLHARLKAAAHEETLSLNDLCIQLLNRKHAEPSSGNQIRQQSLLFDILLDRILSHWEGAVKGILLFGSFARGEASTASDIDILIVLQQTGAISRELYRDWDSYVNIDHSLAGFSPQFVSFSEKDEAVGSLWLEVALEGVVLWDPNFEIARRLIGLRKDIVNGCYIRKLSHGQAYWIRRKEAA